MYKLRRVRTEEGLDFFTPLFLPYYSYFINSIIIFILPLFLDLN